MRHRILILTLAVMLAGCTTPAPSEAPDAAPADAAPQPQPPVVLTWDDDYAGYSQVAGVGLSDGPGTWSLADHMQLPVDVYAVVVEVACLENQQEMGDGPSAYWRRTYDTVDGGHHIGGFAMGDICPAGGRLNMNNTELGGDGEVASFEMMEVEVGWGRFSYVTEASGRFSVAVSLFPDADAPANYTALP